jgi:hypothetical protein
VSNFSRTPGGNAAHFFSGVTKFGEQMLSPKLLAVKV